MSWFLPNPLHSSTGELRDIRQAYERRTKFRHSRPLPPTENREDGTFTTRLHYSGVMEESCGKQYVDGLIEYIHKCDPDRWSKLEVDDFLEKLGLEVSKLEYFYLKPGMNLDEGLVRLFDNKSSMEMAELGLQAGLVDLYVVEANEVLVSQLTQDHTHTPMDREHVFQEARDGDGMTTTDSEDGAGDRPVGADGGENWDGDRGVGADGGEYGDGDRPEGTDGGEDGDGDRQVGTDELEDGQVDKGKGKGNGNGKA